MIAGNYLCNVRCSGASAVFVCLRPLAYFSPTFSVLAPVALFFYFIVKLYIYIIFQSVKYLPLLSFGCNLNTIIAQTSATVKVWK